jgi:putative hydrolase of HD superfamily
MKGKFVAVEFEKQMQFLTEVEKLKIIYRQNTVVDGSRYENSAEHSWHIVLMAMVLLDSSDNKEIDLLRVVKMLVIHDLVEIDVGDMFLYDTEANQNKSKLETAAAKRIFGLLPANQCEEFVALWEEFEKRETPDALFAAALDNMQPLMNHYASEHRGIKNCSVRASDVYEKKKFIQKASKQMWEASKELIRKCEENGLFVKGQ